MKLKSLPLLLLVGIATLVACRAQPSPTSGPQPATIAGLVFRDLNGDGARDAREPGEPNITVAAQDGTGAVVATATTGPDGAYVLNAGLDPAQIVAGAQYVVVFSGWPENLQPGPHGPDSGTEQQFVVGGAGSVNFGLFSPDQYVGPAETVTPTLAAGTTPGPTTTAAGIYTGTAPAPDFPAGLAWFNTGGRPLTWAELRGKVVVLEFWTCGCIRSIQSLPRLRMLAETYPDELVVIWVQAPKFPHEAELENLRRCVQRYELPFPVVNDPAYELAAQYGADIWPTYVFVNPAGRYLGNLEGEQTYARMDRLVREIVAEFDSRGLVDRTPLELVLEPLPETALLFPSTVLADAAGDRLFIADTNHNRIVVTDLVGTVQDVIGSGAAAWRDGDYATAGFHRPQGLALAGPDTLYVADTENQVLRRVDLANRTVETAAGVGELFLLEADSGPALESRLNSPWGMLYVDGLVHITMAGQHQLWFYDPDREWVDLFAGTGDEALVDGTLLGAGFNQPTALATDGRALYVADSEAGAIRRVDLDPAGKVSTIVGQGFYLFGDVDGVGDEVRLQRPAGLAYLDGLLYVADTYNNKIKTVNPETREAATFLGRSEAGLRDGADPLFDEPAGLSIAAGKLYVADTNNHAIRVVDLATRSVSTLVLVDPEGLLTR